MPWKNFYLSPNHALWQGRSDTPEHSAFFQIVKTHNLLKDMPVENKQNTFALLGFCCDEGVRRNSGRIGASDGPTALRRALAKLPVHNQNFSLYDVGNITCAEGNLEESQQALGEVVAKLLSHGMIPIVIGGGHEVAWGHYQGIAKTFSQKKLGIVNFDAHFDMRPLLLNEQGSSGTPFLQIAQHCEKNHRNFDYNCIGIQPTGNIRQLFDTAKKYDVKTLFAEELHQNEPQKYLNFIDRVVDENDVIYTTICLDVFAAGFAPGVSAVQPLGLTPWQALPFIRKLAQSGKVVSYDIAELNPQYDPDERTAKLAAYLVYEIIHKSYDMDCIQTDKQAQQGE